MKIENWKLKIILKDRAGFTVAELLVAMGVFVIVIGIATSVFISSLRAQRAIVSLMAAHDNASVAIEQMAREMRTSTDFSILGSQDDAIRFENANGATVSYRLNAQTGTLERGVCTSSVTCNVPLPSHYSYNAITGTNVRVEHVHFYLVDTILSGTWPPRVTFTLRISSDGAGQTFATDIQTTVSARNL